MAVYLGTTGGGGGTGGEGGQRGGDHGGGEGGRIRSRPLFRKMSIVLFHHTAAMLHQSCSVTHHRVALTGSSACG